jgi:hypothetical protein
MADTRQKQPKFGLDVLVVFVGVAFVVLVTAAGAQAGHPIGKGPAAILGGLYVVYLGVLFLLSCFFPDATYILSFLRYVCEECTRGGRGRHMAFMYCVLGLVLGAWLLLVGLGVV